MLALDFYVLPGLFEWISGEFARVRNWPILSKKPGLAHAFEHGGFWQVLEIAPNFLKGLLYTCIRFSKCLRDYLNGFPVNVARVRAWPILGKSLGYSKCF